MGAWSELIWPDPPGSKPAGVLADIPWVVDLSRKHNWPCMAFGAVALVGAIMVMLVAYVKVWLQRRRRAPSSTAARSQSFLFGQIGSSHSLSPTARSRLPSGCRE